MWANPVCLPPTDPSLLYPRQVHFHNTYNKRKFISPSANASSFHHQTHLQYTLNRPEYPSTNASLPHPRQTHYYFTFNKCIFITPLTPLAFDLTHEFFQQLNTRLGLWWWLVERKIKMTKIKIKMKLRKTKLNQYDLPCT